MPTPATTADLDAAITARLQQLAPELTIGQALMKNWRDPLLDDLYTRRQQAPDPEPTIEKAAQHPSDAIWSAIMKAARIERRPNETTAQAVSRLLVENPQIYDGYRAAYDGA